MGRRIPPQRADKYLPFPVEAIIIEEDKTDYAVMWKCPDKDCETLNTDTINKRISKMCKAQGIEVEVSKYCMGCKRWVPVRLNL